MLLLKEKSVRKTIYLRILHEDRLPLYPVYVRVHSYYFQYYYGAMQNKTG